MDIDFKDQLVGTLGTAFCKGGACVVSYRSSTPFGQAAASDFRFRFADLSLETLYL